MNEKSFYLSKKRTKLIIFMCVLIALLLFAFAFLTWLAPDLEGTVPFILVGLLVLGCIPMISKVTEDAGAIITVTDEGVRFTVGLVPWEDLYSVHLYRNNVHTYIVFITLDDAKYEENFSSQSASYVYDWLRSEGIPVFSFDYHHLNNRKELLQTLMDYGVAVYDVKGRPVKHERKRVS
ncbi:hypothetical protein [Geomicrobium sp. JCM 19037]|uniref:hypothetical protein n=1 Tax=Geomicrobium sp. JCM 19037 TaxID=1460634 RepID=UPI0005A99521|nr:hypothetical protein [Geomicrobium sp. JCM 19037]